MKPFLKTLAAMLAVAVVYFFSGKFGLSLAIVNGSATAVWPPTGIALATTLLWGYRLWPGIFIGAFLVNITTQGSWGTSLGIATGNTLEALIAAGLVRKFAGGSNCFEHARTTAQFILLAGILSTMISATVGVTSLCLGHYAEWNHAWPVWSTWWIGDLTSNLVIAPLLLIWISKRLPKWNALQWVEASLLLLTLASMGWLVFLGGNPFAVTEQLEYLVIPPLLWATFRFGLHGAITSTFLTSGIALWGTLHQMGPFLTPDPNETLLLLQAFTGTITMTILVLGVVVSERQRFQWRLELKDVISRILAGSAGRREATQQILRVLCEQSGSVTGTLWEVDRASNKLYTSAVWHPNAENMAGFEAITRKIHFAPGVGLPGRVWLNGMPEWVPDVTRDDHFPRKSQALHAGLHSAFCFPLKLGNNTLGVIECFHPDIRTPEDDLMLFLIPLGQQLGLFIERKMAEEALRESELRFKQVTESICEVFWLINAANTEMIYISPAYENIWGRTCASLYASPQDWLKAVHPEDYDRIQDAARTTLLRGDYAEEYRIIRPDGSMRWIRARGFPVKDANGRIYRIAGIAEDITFRKQAEFDVALLGHGVESTSELICITDLENRFVFTNPAFRKAYGYSSEELIGRTPAMLFSPNNPPLLLNQILAQSRAGGWSGEILDLRKGGAEFPVFLRTSRVKDHNGNVIALMGVAEDITEAKKAQEQVKALAGIVQSSRDAIIRFTTKRIILIWNKGAEDLFGYTAAEAIGQNISLLWPPDRLQETTAIMSKIDKGELVEIPDTARRHKDGTLLDVSLTISPIRNVNGEIIGSAAIIRDITEKKRLEKLLLEISANERRRIGHDLHDGLGQHLAGTAFKAKALEELLAGESSQHAEEAAKLVNLINEGIRQTRALAQGLDPVDLELAGLPAALQKLAGQTAGQFHLTCDFHCNQERLNLGSPVGQALFRIAQEGIHNAITHGNAKHIVIALDAGDDTLCLSIRDKGRGFQVQGHHTSGMGLRIMRYRALSIGGNLTIHSQIGIGTDVVCLVPQQTSLPGKGFMYTQDYIGYENSPQKA